jgi:acyl-coenzyme A synthetase/AMP-(fatty) acid ligase
MKHFLIDGDLKIDYNQLVFDINNTNTADGVYGSILSILISLSKDVKFSSIDNMLTYFEKNAQSLSINIQTSGTTGDPKNITQSFSNVIRYVKKSNSDYIWAFAYNPNHFAGLQVLFQALFNKNTIVFVFDKDFKQIPSILENNFVTHISCTPTFMNMLLPYMYYIKTLKNISFGGERLSDKVLNKTRELFPKAKIRNIYASSEAGSVLSSNDIGFYIPTRYETLVRIIDNELCIHKSLLGNFNFDGHWYHTGDYVEYIDDVHFVFDSRKSEIVNTGGYRVSLAKVEKYIQTLRGVSNVVVYGRPNSLVGTIIVAEIVCDDRKTIKENIKNTDILTEYEKPKLIKFVESIKLTSTGKIKRK